MRKLKAIMKIDKIKLKGHNDIQISAEVDYPDGKVKYFAIYAPCFTCTKNIKVLKNISKQLVENGVGVLRFDFPGLGESGGKFEETSYTTNLINIKLVSDQLSNLYEAPRLAIGHSMGGSAMLKEANDYSSIEAIATIASPSTPNHLTSVLKKNREEANNKGYSYKTIGGIKFKLTKEFFDNLDENSDNYNLAKFKKPLLVLHSPDDRTVSIDEAAKIILGVKGKKSFITLNNYGHLAMKEEEGKNIANIIYHWADGFISY